MLQLLLNKSLLALCPKRVINEIITRRNECHLLALTYIHHNKSSLARYSNFAAILSVRNNQKFQTD